MVEARGAGAKSGGALPNLRSFGPKMSFFGPKQPSNLFKKAKLKEDGWDTPQLASLSRFNVPFAAL